MKQSNQSLAAERAWRSRKNKKPSRTQHQIHSKISRSQKSKAGTVPIDPERVRVHRGIEEFRYQLELEAIKAEDLW